MKDLLGKEVQEGDIIILPVSRKSHYLVSAKIESLAEGVIMIRFSSTPATKELKPGIKFIKVDHKLPSGLDMYGCIDCTGQRLDVGDLVAYRSKSSIISTSRVKEVIDDLWLLLEDGSRVRNVGIYKIE